MKAKQPKHYRIYLPRSAYLWLAKEGHRCGLNWVEFKTRIGNDGSPHAKWLVAEEKGMASTMANFLFTEDVILNLILNGQAPSTRILGRTNNRMWVTIGLSPHLLDQSAKRARGFKMKADKYRFLLLRQAIIDATVL